MDQLIDRSTLLWIGKFYDVISKKKKKSPILEDGEDILNAFFVKQVPSFGMEFTQFGLGGKAADCTILRFLYQVWIAKILMGPPLSTTFLLLSKAVAKRVVPQFATFLARVVN